MPWGWRSDGVVLIWGMAGGRRRRARSGAGGVWGVDPPAYETGQGRRVLQQSRYEFCAKPVWVL